MAAQQATVEAGPIENAMDLLARMDALVAKNEDWHRIERLVTRVQSAILDIPEDERRESVTAMKRCLERVQSKALASRVDIKDKLSEIQRGRVATRAYGQPPAGSSRNSNTVLR